MGRESIVKKAKCCFFCGSEVGLDKHHIFGAANRRLSEQDGLWVMICHREHTTDGDKDSVHNMPNQGKDKALKQAGELAWLKENGYFNGVLDPKGIEAFIDRYGRNYL